MLQIGQNTIFTVMNIKGDKVVLKKAADIIISCLENKKMSQRQLALSMGEDVRYLNQQLNRQKDMKVERFTDVLDHIGYRIEIIDNKGIKKVCADYAEKIINTGIPEGMFWTFKDGVYTAIYNRNSSVICKNFSDKTSCLKWLLKIKE